MSKKKKIQQTKKNKKTDIKDNSNAIDIKGLFTNISSKILPEKQEVKNTVFALVFFVLFLLFILSAFDFGGSIGKSIYTWFSHILGYGYYVLPFLCITQSYFYSIHREDTAYTKKKIFFASLLLLSVLSILEISVNNAGGALGKFISAPLISLFDTTLSYILSIALFLISLIVLFEYAFSLKKDDSENEHEELNEEDEYIPIKENFIRNKSKKTAIKEENEEIAEVENIENIKDKVNKNIKDNKKDLKTKDEKEVKDKSIIDEFLLTNKKTLLLDRNYIAPPLSLLQKDKGKNDVGDIKVISNIIKRTLQNFGVLVEMDEISVGPSVTRYSLKPAEGVKLSKILSLQDNLSLALAAHPIRIEAPIPGKSLVGIEVPNTTKTMVGLGTLLSSDDYQKSHKPLLIALGKGVSGKMYYEDLARMPHVLIAGTTGSGKSVMMHNLITSLIYKNSPENLRFIFVDPKRVELTLYNKIPHLLTPVITDAKKAILALKWAGKEMTRRYDLLEKHQVRDIDSYHKNILMPALEKAKKNNKKTNTENLENEEEENKNNIEDNLPESMPYIVIAIDELADIMQTYPKELEGGIVRLAQMSRAVGIHLVLSTQRPSVNVITGTIKANVPTRFALQVASQIDSRTILDDRGAEELLGKGDMLFKTGSMSSAQRVQSPNITEEETKAIVKHLIDNMEYIPSTIQLGGEATENQGTNAIFASAFDDGLSSADELEDEDDLYNEARVAVLEAKKASTSYLQRKLRIGYSRAARLIDILEKRGVVGPADGARPREVLIGKDNNVNKNGENDSENEDEDNKNREIIL